MTKLFYKEQQPEAKSSFYREPASLRVSADNVFNLSVQSWLCVSLRLHNAGTLVRPAAGRLRQLRLICTGFAADDFSFLVNE